MNYKIAIIKMGRLDKFTQRHIIVSTPTDCFTLSRHKEGDTSLWSGGLTVEEGEQLVLAYKNDPHFFGRVRKRLYEENECEGCSERGLYTYESFKEMLEPFGLEEKYIRLLFEAICKNDAEMIIEN